MKTSPGEFCLFIYFVITRGAEHSDCDHFLVRPRVLEPRTASARRKGFDKKKTVTQYVAVTTIVTVTTIYAVTILVVVTSIVAVTSKRLEDVLCPSQEL